MLVFSCLLVATTYAQDPSSILDLESNTKGVLVPRMSTADRNALPGVNSPAEGLLVYDTETNSFWYYDEGAWNELDGKEDIMPDGDKSTTTPKPIPDLETINDTITLSGAGIIDTTTRIKVCLDITHLWDRDLDISLIAPDGTTILDLSSDNGGTGNHYRNTCFTTEATVPITAGSPPFTGEFRPEMSFSNLLGQTIAGDWILSIYDDLNGYPGTLNSWSIDIDYDEQIMTKGMSDQDRDTRVVVEEFADDDHVRLFADGAEMMRVSKGTGVALGAIDDGYPGDSVQLNLSGDFNTGSNNGSANGTYKLRIEAYQNDGPTVYPIYVIDENHQVDFYLKNRPSAGDVPSMYFAGNLDVVGTMSKGGGSFKIDHPLDPENKYLYHSFVESPDMMNVYNGNVILDEQGEAIVEMAQWFSALNRDFRYQLTCIGRFSPVYIAEEISDGQFKISGAPGSKVSWQVTGIRQDPFANKNRIPTEVEKEAFNNGKLLHPKAWEDRLGERYRQCIPAKQKQHEVVEQSENRGD